MNKETFKALLIQNAKKASRAKLPRGVLPTAQQRAYAARLAKIVGTLRGITNTLEPHVRALTENVSRLALDAKSKDIGDRIDQARANLAKRWSKPKVVELVLPIAKEIDRVQVSSLNKQLRTLVGVDVVGAEPWLEKAAGEWVNENVSLIKSVSSRYFDQLETMLQKEIADGSRWEEISELIEDCLSVSQANADRIARDQVGKYYGDLNRVRQVDLGISRFAWRTENDNRVRDEHAELNGKIFSWSDLPSEGAPGEAIMCRCYADPVIEDLL